MKNDTVSLNSWDLLSTAEIILENRSMTVTPELLGNPLFRKDYGIKYNYITGAMYKGIASKDLVVAMGKAGLLGFYGTGGLSLDVIEKAILNIQLELNQGQAYGMNLLSNPENIALEMCTVELYLKHNVTLIEASAYIQLSLPLIRYRLAGLTRARDGRVIQRNRIIAKVSRPEIAEIFMRRAPDKLVHQLLKDGLITEEQADLGKHVPVSQDICVEADSGGHTDQGNPYVLTPSIRSLRDKIMSEEQYKDVIRVGAAGGIGTPEAVVAAFMLGADFIVTGSINQCTVEAGTSDAVKDILENINVQDTGYAPAGDMFEMGAKVQVVKKGLFFPARANKLYEIYLRHNSIDEIGETISKNIQEKYFKRSFTEVWEETSAYYKKNSPNKLAIIENNPKQKMAFIFRWYFIHSARLAMSGSEEQRVDYQIHCGPALGAFNQWAKGKKFEKWRNRHVNIIGEHLMQEAAGLLTERLASIVNNNTPSKMVC